MADLINDVVEVANEAGLETTVLEPVAKKFDIKSFVGGTVIGAAGAVLVRKAVKSIKDSQAEIKVETDKVKADKLRKKMDKLAKKLDEIEAVDQQEETPVDEDVVEEG